MPVLDPQQEQATSTFIRNRAHAVNRAFSDAEIFYIPTDLNPANIATKFETGRMLHNGFQDAYKELGDGSPFRSGPSFMKHGLKEAVTSKIITNITSMRISLANKRIARNQLIGLSNREEVDDEETLGHKKFLATTSETPQDNIADETVLLNTASETTFIPR